MRSAEEWAKRLTVFDDEGVAAIVKAAQREAIEAAATAAKVAWLHYPRSEIGDADHDNDLCEFAETQIRALLPTDTKEPTFPAPPASAGERDER